MPDGPISLDRVILCTLGEVAHVEHVVVVSRGAPLEAPDLVLGLTDGRAVAWYGDGRPFVVHPSRSELESMHGVAGWTRAAA